MLVEETINILEETARHVQEFLSNHLPKQYVYHNINHTVNVVNATKEIAAGNDLEPWEIQALLLAAWFHDIGYTEGPKNHETRGAEHAEEFLKKNGYPRDRISMVKDLILATKMPQRPENLLQEIICDADMNSLGHRNYFSQVINLREEWETTGQKTFTEESWLLLELDFLSNHQYHNEASRKLYDRRKKKNINKLRKRLGKLKTSSFIPALVNGQPEEKSAKKRKAYGRGVETMYRSTYRMHINLSAIADNKANIMLSINAIIISITLPSLLPAFEQNPHLIIPTFILLAVCLTSVIFATLSTRPKITQGKFTKEDIANKRSNLLFFGNFYNMDLQDYEMGVGQMIEDEEFLYNSMTRDVYFLGVVLAKKYKYLRICYNIFMFGLVAAVLAFGVAFLVKFLGGS